MTHKTILWSSFLVFYLLITGCSTPAQVHNDESPGPNQTIENPLLDMTAEGYPRLDGSTSTFPLDTLIACKALRVECMWHEDFSGTRVLFPKLTDFEGEIPIQSHSGTHTAYINLIDRDVDMILVARLPSDDELYLAEVAGVTLDPLPIAKDAFVFIVNEDNPVEDLSLAQLQGIYTGEITDWEQVGGPQAEIHPYQRNENSGSQELMRTLVMQGRPMVKAEQMLLLFKMMAPFYAVSDDKLGIGYSVFYYEQNMVANERVKLCAVNGVMPSKESIQSQTYPFTSEVYAVLRSDQPTTSLAYRLWRWLPSTEGQDLVAESGYVPIE